MRSRLEVLPVDPVTGELPEMPIVDFIDLVLHDGKGPVIVNFRTAGRSSARLELAYEIQLAMHALLVREHFGSEESELQIRSLVKTKVPKIETHTFPPRSPEHLRRLFAIIREYHQSLDRGVFHYRPAWTCSMCDLVDLHCRTWSG